MVAKRSRYLKSRMSYFCFNYEFLQKLNDNLKITKMIKNWKITIAFLFGSIIVSFLSGALEYNTINSAGGKIGAIMGPTLLLFLLPMIIAYLIKVIYKLSKNDLKGNRFASTYAITWGILVFLTLSGYALHKQNEYRSSNNSGYLYKPKDSEYSIVFGSKPTITSTALPSGTYFLKGEMAEVSFPNYGDFERVELYLLDKTLLNLIDKDVTYKFLNEYSQYNGLLYPEIKFYENKNEKRGELRAFKEYTDNAGKKGIITYVAKVYIKGETFFVTYVGADSKDFPTKEIERFWNSFK